MRLLVVCQYYYPEPFRITDICESLVNEGLQVTVLTGLPNYPDGIIPKDYKRGKRRREVINGVTVIRVPEIARGKNTFQLFLNYLSFAITGSIYTLFMKQKYNAVLVNQLSPVLMAIPGILASKRQRKPLYLYCLDLWPASLVAGGIKKESKVHAVFKPISKWIYQSATKVLVTSKQFKDYFSQELELTDIEVEYLPQYAESLFDEIEKSIFREQTCFLFAGNIGEAQNLEVILDAAEILLHEKQILINVVGDGIAAARIIQSAKERNLSNIIFHGRKPLKDMRNYYQNTDAFLVTLRDDPILSYTLPGKIQTYLAARRPIVGAINGETASVIKESNAGFCVSAGDGKALANCLLAFSKLNEAEREKMAEAGRRFYDANFTKKVFIENLIFLLKKD